MRLKVNIKSKKLIISSFMNLKDLKKIRNNNPDLIYVINFIIFYVL